MSGRLPSIRRHITINKKVLSASLNKTFASFFPRTVTFSCRSGMAVIGQQSSRCVRLVPRGLGLKSRYFTRDISSGSTTASLVNLPRDVQTYITINFVRNASWRVIRDQFKRVCVQISKSLTMARNTAGMGPVSDTDWLSYAKLSNRKSQSSLLLMFLDTVSSR